MIKFLYIFAITLAVVSAGKMDFKDCGNHEVKSLDVSGCEGKYCVIHKGKDLNIELKTLSNQDSEHLKLQILANINGLEIEVPGLDTDGCHYVKCPIQKGQEYDIKYSYKIPSVLPNVKATLTAKVIGDKGLASCLMMDGEIKD